MLTNDGVDEKRIIEIVPHKKMNFGNNISIFPISVNHSTPDSVMYVINTPCITISFITQYFLYVVKKNNIYLISKMWIEMK